MKISGASVLALAFVVLCSSSTTNGLDLGTIIGGLTSPLLPNLTTPILGGIVGAPTANASVSPGGLNLSGTLTNVTGGVVVGLNPGLNLTNIVGTINNITGPLVDALVNLTGSPANLSVSTNITVSISLNLPSAVVTNPSITFPNNVLIAPVGPTVVVITVYAAQSSNASSIPITIAVPVLSYLNFPVSGSAEVTVDFPLGSTLVITGITNPISRLFFGVSWQTFPQLTSVVISKLLPGASHPDPFYTLDIPALICKAFSRSFNLQGLPK